MNKKLIAVALAALPVAAMADVTIYGALKGSVERDTVTNQASQNRVEDNTSIIGFKGTEDLGNGLKTVWQVESRVKLDNSNSGTDGQLGSRQTFVGLDAGNIGMFRMGFLNNVLNDQYAVDQWQYHGVTSVNGLQGVNGLGTFTNSGDRLKNAVRYDSATFAGFSGSVVYGFGENEQKTPNPDGTTKASSIWGVGLNYTYGPVAAHYAYNKEVNPNQPAGIPANAATTWGSNGGQSANKQLLEVDYNQDNLFLSAAYQWSTGYDWVDDFAGDGSSSYAGVNPVAGKLKARQAALSAAYTIGAFTPKFTYAKGWNLKSNDSTIQDSGYSQYILGVDYALSKRTTTGVAYGYLKMEKGTSTAQSINSGSSVTAKTLAVTMAHSF